MPDDDDEIIIRRRRVTMIRQASLSQNLITAEREYLASMADRLESGGDLSADEWKTTKTLVAKSL